MIKKKLSCLLLVFVLFASIITGCSNIEIVFETDAYETEENVTDVAAAEISGKTEVDTNAPIVTTTSSSFDLSQVPAYTDEPYVFLNDNTPYFTEDEITADSFEYYSELDSLGRCGVTIASIGRDLMPTEKRESIAEVKPTGWHSVKYDFVNGKSLYNRCHLIGFQLAGENANPKNLITGTRYLNIEGMLPFEDMVADYVKETGNHVMYRVTPIFEGDNLVADGVLMEGLSVEDDGQGIMFCAFAYNVQPGVEIDYATGDNWEAKDKNKTSKQDVNTSGDASDEGYVLNISTKKFHLPSCTNAINMKEKNKQVFTGERQDLIDEGYEPCGKCNP